MAASCPQQPDKEAHWPLGKVLWQQILELHVYSRVKTTETESGRGKKLWTWALPPCLLKWFLQMKSGWRSQNTKGEEA